MLSLESDSRRPVVELVLPMKCSVPLVLAVPLPSVIVPLAAVAAPRELAMPSAIDVTARVPAAHAVVPCRYWPRQASTGCARGTEGVRPPGRHRRKSRPSASRPSPVR